MLECQLMRTSAMLELLKNNWLSTRIAKPENLDLRDQLRAEAAEALKLQVIERQILRVGVIMAPLGVYMWIRYCVLPFLG